MKLGICSLWGADIEAFRAEIRLASDLGYAVIGAGDSPSGWHDLYVSLTICALEAPNATIAPLITSPFLRHPIATANALSSIDDLSGGRVALGLATGGSTVMAIGRPPASQAEIKAEFDALEALFDGRETEFLGAPVKAMRFARKVPIYYSAFGPKALALAGERADGVILFGGSEDIDGLAGRIAAVRDAATRAGRDADTIDIWMMTYAAIRETRAAAIDDIKPFVVVNGMAIRTPETLAKVPTQFRGKIDELHRRYDPFEHVVVGGKNVRLLDELGLSEYLAQFDTIAGPPALMTDTLRKVEALGVSTVIAALPGHGEPLQLIRTLAAARDAM